MRSRALVLAAAAALACVGFSQFIPSEPSTVTVTQPTGLVDYFAAHGGIPHNEALFGIPAYGDTLSGPVKQLVGQSACGPIVPDPSWGSGYILMLPRGNCTFETKVYYAQVAGAAGVLIADNALLCGDPNAGVCVSTCTSSCSAGYIPGPNPNNCECFLPYLADDHSHVGVNIPSFIISNNSASQIAACLNGQSPCDSKNNVVLVDLTWPLPKPDDRVEWAIWGTADDDISVGLRADLQPFVKPLGSDVQFTGRAFIYDGQEWGCTQPWFPCGTQCAFNGQFCSPDPDGDLDSGHSGADIVFENLRQICIFQQANATVATDFGLKYWKYTALFYANCLSQNNWADCSVTQQTAAGLDPAVTASCVSGSTSPSGTDNSLLENEVRLREDYLILVLPTVVVNEQVLRGQPTAVGVLSAICNGFATKTPAVCACTAVSSDWLTFCAENGIDQVPVADGGKKVESSGTASWAVALIVLLVLAVVGLVIGGVIAYKRAHKNMETMLEDYRRLEAEEAVEDSKL